MEYKGIDEVKKLGLNEFVAYCKGINDEIVERSARGDIGFSKAIDQYHLLKGIEDKYIILSLQSVYNDSKGSVLGFNIEREVTCEDDGWNSYKSSLGTVVLDESRKGYTIYDKDGKRVPFSYVSELCAVFGELLYCVGIYFENKKNVIVDESA